ncbi:MAG: hypothetical protein H7Z40_05505 [Phycisphaerae bacterium]|nr:hypothetical protein [Gemmatimonadaceae bacterium]
MTDAPRNFFFAILDVFTSEWRDKAVMARVHAERRARVAPMRNDPSRAKFVELILRGDTWPDADIAFNVNPAATFVCEHLRPVEQGLRAQGILMRLGAPLQLRAGCQVNADSLVRAFHLAGPVAYRELPFKDRSLLDPDIAVIECESCNSFIQVVHRDSAKPDTPWFPR